MRTNHHRSGQACAPAPAAIALLVAMMLAAVAPPRTYADMTLSLSPVKTRPLTKYRGHEDETLREQTATFDLGTARYAISYKAGYKDSAPDRAFPLEGYIGMPVPTPCNWYHSGFLWVVINGQDIGETALSSMTTLMEDDRGYTDLVWHHELADVRARFIGIAGKTALYCAITVEPAAPLETLTVRARCYPSFFTSHHNRTGARRIQTPATLVEQGQNTSFDASANWWLCYYDEVFDVAKGEGSGPCAMLILPDQAGTIACKPGGYAVGTEIQYPPETTTIRLAFWDFKGRHNQDVLADMPNQAAATRNELAKLDPTPRAIRDATLQTRRDEIRAILESDVCRKALGQTKVAAMEDWLNVTQTQNREQHNLSVTNQEKILRGIGEMQDLVWEGKLARLLSEF